MARLNEGDQAPDFTLASTHGPITLSSLCAESERGVVVYFYPKASTPGCTKEACDFRDNLARLQAHGYRVIGISPDQLPALTRFTENQALTFPLCADPDKTVMEGWGAWGEKQNYGKTVTGTIRSTIVVDRDAKVVLARYNVKATGHVQRLCRELGVEV